MNMADTPAARASLAAYRRGVQADAEAQLRNAYPGARTTCTDDPGGGFTVQSTSRYGDAKMVFVPQDPPEGVTRLVERIREMHELVERTNRSTTTSSEVG
jgi:hypothetical protein